MSRRTFYEEDYDFREIPRGWPEEIREACDGDPDAIDWEDRRGPRINVTACHWVTVDPEVIDGDVVSWFRNGNCAFLAWRMHLLTGWPLVILRSAKPNHPEIDDRTWFHVGVREPGGRFVDISGAHYDDEEMLRDWEREFSFLNGTYAVEVSRVKFFRVLDSPEAERDETWDYSEIEVAVTDHYARMVTRQVVPTLVSL